MEKRIGIIAGLLLFVTVMAQAQSISPVIVQGYGPTYRNAIEIKNNGLMPMIVTLEGMSFDDGPKNFRPLDPGISLKLSEASFRVAAKSSHKVFYEAKCAQTPCWFTIYSSMGGISPKRAASASVVEAGLAVSIHLPHVVYLLSPKSFVQKSDIAMTWQEDGNLRIENRSREFVRAMALEMHYADGHKITEASFPLFPTTVPGAVKTFRVPKPDYILLRFDNFTIDSRKP